MEPFLVKVLATALTLSQVLTTPNALKTHFDPDSDQQVAQLLHAGCVHTLKNFGLENVHIDALISVAMRDPQAIGDWDAFDACLRAAKGRPSCVLKIVVFDEDDYSYARMVAARYPMLAVYLQVGNPAPLTATGGTIPEDANTDDLLHRFRWLAGRVTADRWFAATVLPQLHVLAWGNKRGV